jgi:hypothetical protein
MELNPQFLIVVGLLLVAIFFLITQRMSKMKSKRSEIISSGCLSLLGDGEVTIAIPFTVERVSIRFIDDGPSTQPSCMPNAPDSAEVQICEEDDGIDIQWSVGSVRQLKWEVVGCE